MHRASEGVPLQWAWATRSLLCLSGPPSLGGGYLLLPIPPAQTFPVWVTPLMTFSLFLHLNLALSFRLEKPAPFAACEYYWPALDCCGLFEASCFNECWGEEDGLCGMSRGRRGGRACSEKQLNTLKCKSTICPIKLESFTLILNNLNSVILAV